MKALEFVDRLLAWCEEEREKLAAPPHKADDGYSRGLDAGALVAWTRVIGTIRLNRDKLE